MSIQFRTSQNIIKLFTQTELDQMLLTLNAYNQYYQSGNDDLVFIRVSMSELLIIDLDFLFNKRLFENYSFQSSVENVFGLRLIGINNVTASELSVNDALLTIGYGGPLPISSLESIFMTIYVKTSATTRQRKAPVHFNDEIITNNKKVTNIQKKTLNLMEENVYNISRSHHNISKKTINIMEEHIYNITRSNNIRKSSVINLFEENVVSCKNSQLIKEISLLAPKQSPTFSGTVRMGANFKIWEDNLAGYTNLGHVQHNNSIFFRVGEDIRMILGSDETLFPDRVSSHSNWTSSQG